MAERLADPPAIYAPCLADHAQRPRDSQDWKMLIWRPEQSSTQRIMPLFVDHGTAGANLRRITNWKLLESGITACVDVNRAEALAVITILPEGMTKWVRSRSLSCTHESSVFDSGLPRRREMYEANLRIAQL